MLDQSSLPVFLHQGWYGIGSGAGGPERLAAALRSLHADRPLRDSLGSFSRSVVTERFSLQRAAEIHERIYEEARHRVPSRRAFALRAAGPLARAVSHESRHWLAARRGEGVTEDFNHIGAQARPVPTVRGTTP